MENDLAYYISEQLKISHSFFQWKVVKDTKKQIIEVLCTFRVDTKEEVQVQDVLGKNNEAGYIQFEEVFCFYDPAVSHVQPENYLRALPFDNQLGIEKGRVDAFVRQINRVMSQGHRNLIEFVEDVTEGVFELQWNEKDFNQTIDTLKQTGRYDERTILMKIDEDETLVDQLTGDDESDGVERI